MKVLITGSSGRVGRAIHIHLSPAHDVAGYDRNPSSTSEFVGTLDDADLLRDACSGVDAIVHTAALHAPHVPHVSEAEFRRINVDGTRRVLDAAVRAGVARIVFTSTTALYGTAATPGGVAGWVDEQLEPQPETIYHRTKLEAEALLREAARQGGPVLRVLRMSRCFPEPVNVMALLRLHRGVDARDVAHAHELALTDAGAAQATYVVSGDTPFLREDVAALHEDARCVLQARCPALVEDFARLRWPLPRRIDRVYCAHAARGALGWSARRSYRDVLDQWTQESSEILPPRLDAGLPA
jgi:UDP-glucose 4-epimerase